MSLTGNNLVLRSDYFMRVYMMEEQRYWKFDSEILLFGVCSERLPCLSTITWTKRLLTTLIFFSSSINSSFLSVFPTRKLPVTCNGWTYINISCYSGRKQLPTMTLHYTVSSFFRFFVWWFIHISSVAHTSYSILCQHWWIFAVSYQRGTAFHQILESSDSILIRKWRKHLLFSCYFIHFQEL